MFPELMGISLLIASVVSVHITSKQPEYIIGVDHAKPGSEATFVVVSATQATHGQNVNVIAEFEPWYIAELEKGFINQLSVLKEYPCTINEAFQIPPEVLTESTRKRNTRAEVELRQKIHEQEMNFQIKRVWKSIKTETPVNPQLEKEACEYLYKAFGGEE